MTIGVFAVEPTAVQLHWHALSPGSHIIEVADETAEIDGDGGPGAVVVDGLPSGEDVDVWLDGQLVACATTLTPPPGDLLAKVATIGDLHLGETTFGELPRYRSDPNPALAHPVFCTGAAINELLAWGAELLVVKGDIAHDNHRAEYDLAGELLGDLPIPVIAIPGNHDGGDHRNHDVEACLARYGINLVRDVTTTDLPGLRIVTFDSTQPGQKGADLKPLTPAVTAAASEADGGALVVMHHQLMTTPIPTYWPPGVSQGVADRFLDALERGAAGGSGHRWPHASPPCPTPWPAARHRGRLAEGLSGDVGRLPRVRGRHRYRSSGSVDRARGDPLDGADGGQALLGAWGRWSPGRLTDRCVSHPWVRSQKPVG